MKQILLPLLGATFALSANAQTLFSTDLNSQDEFNAFSVIDANNDGRTWIFSEDATNGERTYYPYHGENKADDWLISPALTPSVDGQYLVTYSFKGSSYGEALQIYYGDEPTVEALSKNLAADYPLVTDTQNTGYFFVEATAGKPFYVAFYACSEADKWRLCAQKLEVTLCANPVDLTVAELTAPVSGEDLGSAETIKLKIANNGLVDAPAGSYTVNINIDGEDKFTETINQVVPKGGEIEVALSTPVDLSISHHTYSIIATVSHPDDISAGNNSLKTDVRHIGPAVEPYTLGFEASEDLTDLKFFNLNEDTGYWSIQTDSWWVAPSRSGVRSMCYNYSRVNQADDWAILEGIHMSAGYHVLKYWVSTMDDDHTEAYSIYWGSEAIPAAMTNKIAEYNPYSKAEYTQKICIFKVDKDQTVYIGFHATSPANQNWIAIDDIEINSISADAVELGITGVTAPSDGAYIPQKASHDVAFSVMNKAIKDAEGKITIKIDDAVVSEETVTLVAQEDKSFTKKDLLSNLSVGTHTLEVSVYNAEDQSPADNTVTLSFIILDTPTIAYDFEDGNVPSAFTVRSEDSNTLSSYAVAEFGETGVGILDLESHQYYGNHMLGISTWFTETSYADRWVVLPKVKVDSADATFVLNAGSTNAAINESYSVKVSDASDTWYDYTSLFKVSSENYVRKNRGASLAEYVGKEVYIAINVTTFDGDCLSIDNIGITGCSLVDNSGVNDISIKDNANVIFDGNILTFGDFDSVNLNVYNLSGQLVYSANGKTFSLANLQKGVYVLKASTPNGVITTKVVK